MGTDFGSSAAEPVCQARARSVGGDRRVGLAWGAAGPSQLAPELADDLRRRGDDQRIFSLVGLAGRGCFDNDGLQP